MKLSSLVPVAVALTVSVGALAAPAAATSSGWQDGSHMEDTILNCWTGQPATGLSANVGWSSASGQVPKVGEVFQLRGYIALVGLPCSSGAVVVPEILVPPGVEFAEGPVTWGEGPMSQVQLGTSPLSITRGVHGGPVLALPGDEPFHLDRGDLLEFQFPVVATRELKGTATPPPTCPERTKGTDPCPVEKSGDHFQVAFTVGGHGGNMRYLTPYVPLFAAAASSADGKAASATTAKFRVFAKRPGRAAVTVTADPAAEGTVVVRDLAKDGRVVGKGVLKPTDKGRISIRIAKLGRGVHRLVAQYAGSATIAPSASSPKKIRLR